MAVIFNRAMPGDRRFTVTYEILGQEKTWTVTMTKGMCATPQHIQINAKVLVASVTKFRTAAQYNSFKILKVTEVTAQTHDFWPHVGGMCRLEVERPDGRTEECMEPVKSPAHDPVAYLTYAAELKTALKDWQAQ